LTVTLSAAARTLGATRSRAKRPVWNIRFMGGLPDLSIG